MKPTVIAVVVAAGLAAFGAGWVLSAGGDEPQAERGTAVTVIRAPEAAIRTRFVPADVAPLVTPTPAPTVAPTVQPTVEPTPVPTATPGGEVTGGGGGGGGGGGEEG
jgi:hypothetical protein